MKKYISSKTIENETKRLSLIGAEANPHTVFKLCEIKRKFSDIKKILDVGCGAGEV